MIFLGIFFGLLLSFAASIALTRFLDSPWLFSFPLAAAITGLIVASSIGIIFGIYPARKAAKKNPIESLNYE